MKAWNTFPIKLFHLCYSFQNRSPSWGKSQECTCLHTYSWEWKKPCWCSKLALFKICWCTYIEMDVKLFSFEGRFTPMHIGAFKWGIMANFWTWVLFSNSDFIYLCRLFRIRRVWLHFEYCHMDRHIIKSLLKSISVHIWSWLFSWKDQRIKANHILSIFMNQNW